jgi:small subunit ribosomal protein S9
MEKTTRKKTAEVVSAPKRQPIHGVGRRKRSVARVWLRPGSGKVLVNGVEYLSYFPNQNASHDAILPLKVTSLETQFDVQVNLVGGGFTGQSGAVKLGIARALVAKDEGLRAVLRQHGLLTRDPREVERKKPGRAGARRRFQFVKR